MKPETVNWLKLAEEDYQTALFLFKAARHPYAVYLMGQALEKALKAARIECLNETAKHSHNLESLGRHSGLNFSDVQYQALAEVFKHYQRVRYRDISQEHYNTKVKVQPIIDQAQQLYLWILHALKNR